ncbi:hypothetical protein B0H19DRAFT_427383 [Mycena capillaripes]|nr:hypothetical protein B0H19DRAFT_427383 [Mycena capillaripes]
MRHTSIVSSCPSSGVLRLNYYEAPAEHVVRHQIVKFSRGVGDDIAIYERRPSAAVGEAWEELYSGKIPPQYPGPLTDQRQRTVSETKIPRSEAMKLPNMTWPLQSEPGNYAFALDVFHQLHCLDMLRQQLHLRHNYTRIPISHVRHCIGAIRQALMCSADISTVVWQWSAERQLAEQRDDVVHVCRDFDRIRDWASKHTFVFQPSDFNVYVEDGLAASPG